MTIQNALPPVNRDIDLLAPFVKDRLITGCNNARNDGYMVAPFECWRSPMRQQMLYDQSRTVPPTGPWVTDAKAWFSMHQYGLAFDLAFLINGQWTWDGAYDKITPYFTALKLEPISSEKGHFQMKGGLKTSEIMEINQQFGLLALWARIKATL